MIDITVINQFCLFDGFKCHFQQYFSYIVAVSVNGGENWSTQRKPPTCRKSLTNFITCVKCNLTIKLVCDVVTKLFQYHHVL